MSPARSRYPEAHATLKRETVSADSEGLDTIHTVWVLARQFEDEACSKPTGVWNSFLTNSDVFSRESPG